MTTKVISNPNPMIDLETGECQLNSSIRQCCCNCIHLMPVHYHCCTEPKPNTVPESKCVCGIQKGWACVAPESGIVYDNWPKHSAGCECHTPKSLIFIMKTKLTFPTVKPCRNIDEYTHYPNRKNGLWHIVESAYSRHIPIEISPDLFFNTIACIWSKCIFLNAEKFRSKIVQHQGKKTLIYKTNTHVFTQENIQAHLDAFIKLIEDDQNTSCNWLNVDFSTSDILDRFVRKTAVLASQKAYYEYRSMLLCGFPEIRFTGTPEDWQLVADKISEMPTYDSDMQSWKEKVLFVLNKFNERDENDVKFWQKPFTKRAFGSGQQGDFVGWATIFSPFDEKGQWNAKSDNYYLLKDGDLLDLNVDFEIVLADQFNMQYDTLLINAGPTNDHFFEGCFKSTSRFSWKLKSQEKPKSNEVEFEIVRRPNNKRLRKLEGDWKIQTVLVGYKGDSQIETAIQEELEKEIPRETIEKLNLTSS